jgi:hypothetical protein
LYAYRQELERLQYEHQLEDEKRQEKEENMWRLHEEHRAEIEAERQRLATQKETQEHEKSIAELELEQAHMQLEQERLRSKNYQSTENMK